MKKSILSSAIIAILLLAMPSSLTPVGMNQANMANAKDLEETTRQVTESKSNNNESRSTSIPSQQAEEKERERDSSKEEQKKTTKRQDFDSKSKLKVKELKRMETKRQDSEKKNVDSSNTSNRDDMKASGFTTAQVVGIGTLTVIKRVINNDGLSQTAGQFTLFVEGEPVTIAKLPPNEQKSFRGDAFGTPIELLPGTYSITENDPNYDATFSDDCSGTINAGDRKICTVINDDKAFSQREDVATLIVQKRVINNNGLSKQVSSFLLSVDADVVSIDGVPPNVQNNFHGSNTGTRVVIKEGPYTVIENDPDYTTTFSPDCSGVIKARETKTCTVTNDDKPPGGLSITLNIINDDFGDITFNSIHNAKGVISGTATFRGLDRDREFFFPGEDINGIVNPVRLTVLGAGSYEIKFKIQSEIEKVYDILFSSDCKGNISGGQSKSCIVTLNDKEPTGSATIIFNKQVINDDGGNAQPGSFAVDVCALEALAVHRDPRVISGRCWTTISRSNPTGFSIQVPAGIPLYLAEFHQAAGYEPTSRTCPSSSDPITLEPQSILTCTIVNDDIPLGSLGLELTVNVINDNGGIKVASDFSFRILSNTPLSDGATTFGGSLVNQIQVVNPNIEGFLSEPILIIFGLLNPPPGYKLNTIECEGKEASILSGDRIKVEMKGSLTKCTLSIDDIPGQPRLTIIKHVINDNGGTKVASNFGITVNNIPTSGAVVLPRQFTGVESPGTIAELQVGSYSVTEAGPSGYSSSFSSNCSGFITAGQSKTCTITNNDIAPKLVVTKHVINNGGGFKRAQDFTMRVTGNSPSLTQFLGSESPGTTVTLKPGSYSVDEDAVQFYTKFRSPNCFGTIDIGQTKTCTITNDDEVLPPPGTLIVKKLVRNNDGALKGPSDFRIHVNGQNGASPSIFQGSATGTSVSIVPGSYSVTEDSVSEYKTDIPKECSGTITSGETKTCTIINDDKQALIRVVKHVINNEDGSAVASDFKIGIGQLVSRPPIPSSVVGSEDGQLVSVTAGIRYQVKEIGESSGQIIVGAGSPQGPDVYQVSYSGDCIGFVNNGQTKTCTVTNNDLVQ